MPEQIQTLDVVRKLYDGLERFDVDAVLRLFDRDVEIFTPTSLPWSTGYYQGLDGAADYFGNALDYLEANRFDVEEIRTAGEWAAAIGNWAGRFASSGGEFDVRFVHFWELRDGLIRRGEGISDTDGIVRAYHATPAEGAAPTAD